MPDISIRPAQKDDAQLILDFVIELAIYEKAEHEVEATVADIEKTILSSDATAHCVIAESAGRPAGFAVYFYNYSTWQGKNGLYLEDLFVSPDFRGEGIGKALLQFLARHALANNCGRFEWSVLDWNTPAIDFYESLGAEPKSEWLGYRLAGEALENFAATNG